MPNFNLDRQVLAQFLPNHQAITAFEQMQNSVSTTLPSTIEEAAAAAALATSFAESALTLLAEAMAELERMQSAPAAIQTIERDDTAPRAELGTISPQDAEAVDITGGRIGLDAGTVALPSFYLGGDTTTGLYRIGSNNWGLSIAAVKLADFSATAAAFTQNVSTTKQLISTLAVGIAPLVVTSTTLVPNLYVARAVSADTATVLASPTVYPANATDLSTVITLANALKAANIAKGV